MLACKGRLSRQGIVMASTRRADAGWSGKATVELSVTSGRDQRIFTCSLGKDDWVIETSYACTRCDYEEFAVRSPG